MACGRGGDAQSARGPAQGDRDGERGTHTLELAAEEEDLEVQERPRALWVEVRLAKLAQDGGEVAQAVLLVRRLALALGLAHERQLEPQPVLGRLRHAGHVAPRDLDAPDKLVQGVLVRVARVGQVPDALVVLGEEPVAQELGQAAVRGVEPRLEVRDEALLELLDRLLVLGRERERLLGVTRSQEVVDAGPDGRVVGDLWRRATTRVSAMERTGRPQTGRDAPREPSWPTCRSSGT